MLISFRVEYNILHMLLHPVAHAYTGVNLLRIGNASPKVWAFWGKPITVTANMECFEVTKLHSRTASKDFSLNRFF